MKLSITKMTGVGLALVVLLLIAIPIDSIAQERIPREYTNPDEMVTLASETTFPQAMQIIGSFSRRFTEKTLVDRTGKVGQIGFSIPYMHWRRALDYIANAHNLAIMEYSDSIELVFKTAESPNAQPVEIPDTVTSEPLPPGALVPALATLETREVDISAIFFEGNRRQLREIGIDWSLINNGVINISSFNAGGVSLESFQVSSMNQSLGGDWEVSALMNALEANNVGQILSSPRVKVMDGKVGDIQVGQDISIKQRDFAGNVTDEFFKTGTILTVTPHVISASDTTFILLDIKAERSTAQPDPVSTVINKQQAATQLLLYSGETAIIAGLYETEELTIRRGIPFLKDLPPWFFGLRYLFGYNSRDYREKELVILIKAELVPSLLERFNQKRATKEEQLDKGRQQIRELNLQRIRENQ